MDKFLYTTAISSAGNSVTEGAHCTIIDVALGGIISSVNPATASQRWFSVTVITKLPDASVERFVKLAKPPTAVCGWVEKLGLEKDTLIMFVPDHGSYRHGKATLHDYGMRVPLLCIWPGNIKPDSKYDGITANIDIAPTIFDICGITPPADYKMDGVSFKAQLLGDNKQVRNILFGELGHSRAVKTKEWKYIAVRYPEDIQKKIDDGVKFKGYTGETLERPYLTRNQHLGYYAAKRNPHYFELDQLYNLKTDHEETKNVSRENPEVTERMKKALSVELKKFKDRPFGEF